MPIRRAKQHSERGSIKDIANGETPYFQPEPSELRARQLFEYAQLNNDKQLQAATGFITTDYISDKNTLPLSVYRIRRVVADIKSKSSVAIDQLSQEIEQGIKMFIAPDAKDYWDNKNSRAQIKNASVRKPPFWRARD